MSCTLLLTSFSTWEPHQRSNSSDDVLHLLEQRNPLPLSLRSQVSLHFLRQLPVDFNLAPQQAIARFQQLAPQITICCGMTEARPRVNVEARAITPQSTLYTDVDVDWLTDGLEFTEISYDAGRFVCNHLYFTLLQQVRSRPDQSCVFIHVPVLTPQNRGQVLRDMTRMIERLANNALGLGGNPRYSQKVLT
jgi:pyroglutamyl-peptidase